MVPPILRACYLIFLATKTYIFEKIPYSHRTFTDNSQSKLIGLKLFFAWNFEVRFDPCEIRLNSGKLRKLRKLEFFEFLNVHSNLRWKKTIILAKSNLRKVRFNLREIWFTSHPSDSSLLDIFYFYCAVNSKFLQDATCLV